MQAVPTRYYGVEYRSQTEAEWAAVLSAHDIAHQYEPTVFFFGLVVPAGWIYVSAYLPDFWLPKLGLWLEIKPYIPNLIEYRKAALLADCTGSQVMITTGRPAYSDAAMLLKDVDTFEAVSTLNGNGPLRLNVGLLSVVQDVYPGLRHINSVGWPLLDRPERRRVLFLLPEDDYRASCFCGREPFGQCWFCDSLMRSYVTDESAKRLEAAGAKFLKRPSRGVLQV